MHFTCEKTRITIVWCMHYRQHITVDDRQCGDRCRTMKHGKYPAGGQSWQVCRGRALLSLCTNPPSVFLSHDKTRFGKFACRENLIELWSSLPELISEFFFRIIRNGFRTTRAQDVVVMEVRCRPTRNISLRTSLQCIEIYGFLDQLVGCRTLTDARRVQPWSLFTGSTYPRSNKTKTQARDTSRKGKHDM